MSGGSQHNPNGRQSQNMGPSWSPLQLQMANLLARAPQAHMASERGVTWHTPTPPPHLYHVPAPSPPDPLQAMKNAGNSVFRHTATPPELYRHTPTPPDKHHMRHTPSPGDVKGGSALPPSELYAHLGPGRDKLRPDELLSYARVGVDLSVGSRSTSNGSANSLSITTNNTQRDNPLSVRDTTTINSALTVRDATTINSALTVRDATTINSGVTVRDATVNSGLTVRDAPTINSLIARAGPRPPHARVDALLERLVPSPVSPHSVIVHSRAAPTPSPPSSNEDSADSCGTAPGSKRKRKPERTVRLAHPAPPPRTPPAPLAPAASRLENGDAHAPATPPGQDDVQPQPEKSEPDPPQEQPQPSEPERPPTRRKSRSRSAETIDDIAAMIASTTGQQPTIEPVLTPEPHPATIDNLISVLASPDTKKSESEAEGKKSPAKTEEKPTEAPPVETAAAPRRRSARTSNTEATNVPIESPSEAKPAEPEAEPKSVEPTSASFVDVEKQLENMCAGLEESNPVEVQEKITKARKRRKSAPTKGDRKDRKASRRASRASEGDEAPRKKVQRKRSEVPRDKKKESTKDAYDSGSNASSSRSRGPYIQIRGPRASPSSVSVVNACSGEDEDRRSHFRRGLRVRGLHASTLGLRYDAQTPDVSWLCAFCDKGPHAAQLGDLFGPYTLGDDCDQYRELDEATRRRYTSQSEVWFHAACGVWAPGLVAAGARVWGLAAAVWGARATRCAACCRPGAAVACSARSCRARSHVPCARAAGWRLCDVTFRALCAAHGGS